MFLPTGMRTQEHTAVCPTVVPLYTCIPPRRDENPGTHSCSPDSGTHVFLYTCLPPHWDENSGTHSCLPDSRDENPGDKLYPSTHVFLPVGMRTQGHTAAHLTVVPIYTCLPPHWDENSGTHSCLPDSGTPLHMYSSP